MNKASLIPAGTALVGEIEGDADLVVMGRVEGPIHVGGALVIESTGQVRGHVRARTITVRGVLKGDAYGEEAVRVERSARLVGELTSPRVKVVPGAAFRGQIHVGDVGEPRLQIYDPSLHTFSGHPAPDTQELPPAPRVPASSDVPPATIEEHDSLDDAPTLSEARPTMPFIPKDREESLVEARPTLPFIPKDSKKKFELKMPTLGRKRGRRRAEV